MGRELGRISGPLLAENLLRNGNNLAFETNLLYLDVVNGWIGIKNATPTRTLNITGKTNTTNLIVDTGATVANLEFTTSQIQNVSGSVTLSPNQSLNPTVNVPRLTTAFFDVTTNSINNTVLDSNIVLDPMGTGRLVVTTANVDIRGSLHATGNITWDGSVVLGDSDTDNVTFNADINSNIIPNVTNASNLGSVAKEWRNLYSRNLSSNNFVSSTLTVNGNTTVTGDASIDGSVTLGNEATDTVTIYDHLTQSINPKLPNTYTLGKITGTPKIWNTLYAGLLNVDAVTQISNNTITTLTTDTDLQLTAAGTGTVSVVTTDVDIANNLTVLGSSNTQAVGIVGTLDLPGSFTYIQTGNASRTGATNITGNVTVNGANVVQFQDIKFDNNKITTTLGNNDLTFTASGTGIVKVVNTDVQVDNNLTVSLTSNANSVTATSASANAYDIGSVYITGNTITTDTLNTNLVLSANGTGIINVTTTDVTLTNNLTVNGSSTLAGVGIVGTLDLPGLYTYAQTGATSRIGDTGITGNVTVNGANVVQFQDIKFDSNKITTTLGNNDLTFTANGTGIVKVINSDVQVDNNLTVSLTGYFGSAQVNTRATSTDLYVDSIYIVGNSITTTGTDTNLVLSANGTGIINVTTTDVALTNNLTVNSSSTLAGVGIVGTLDLPGSYTYAQTGVTTRTGATNITGNVTVNGANVVQFPEITFDSNKITTTNGNTDLKFTANGTGIVKVINSDVQVDNNLTVSLTLNANSLQTASSVIAVDFNIGSLYIKDNISVVPTNTNLILSAYAGKNVHLLTSDVNIPQTLTVAGPFTIDGTSTLKAVTVVGAVTQTGNIVQTGVTGVTGTFGAAGNIIVTGPSSFLSVNNVKLDANIISATTTDANLEFRANGVGGVVLERYLKFTNNTISNIFDSNNIELSASNLVLTEDGQNLILESGDFYLADTLLDSDFSIKFTPTGTGNLVINSNKAFAVAYGNNTNRLLTDLGEIRQNSTTNVYEGKSGAGTVSFTGIYDTDGNSYVTAGTTDNILRFGINGSVKATVSSANLFSDTLHADNVRISGTIIDNLINSNDLILSPNGTGTVKVNNLGLAGNKFTNNSNTALVFENTGTGYVQFTGTYGILLPRGLSGQRAVAPEIGETRYNTTGNYLEVFDGTYWVAASGSQNIATLDEIQAELDLWSLILG